MFFTVEKDTLVEGINCRLIAGKDGRHVVYEKKGRVYYYFMNKFRKIYDFNVKVGDVAEFEFKTSGAVDADEAIDRLNTTIVLPCRIESITTKVVDGISLSGIDGRKNAIKDFLAAGKFEDDVYYFPGVWPSSL